MKSTSRSLSRRSALVLAGSIAALVTGHSASGAVVTWNGNSSNFFSLGFSTTPANGDTLSFGPAGAAGTTLSDDIAALTVGGSGTDGIDFATSASAYTINRPGTQTLTLASSGAGIGINDLSLNAETISVPLTLASTQTINVGSRMGSLTLSGVISGAFGLTQTGNGLLTLSGANSFTGPVTINGGTLAVASDSVGATNPLGSGAAAVNLIIDGGALRTTAATQLSINRTVLLGDSGASTGGTIDVLNGNTLTYNGVMTNNGGTNSLTKTGIGTLLLGGASTYTGSTIVNQGILKLDFSQATAPVGNILNSGSALVLGGIPTSLGTGVTTNAASATLNMTSKNNANSTQTFNGVTLNAGNNTIQTTQTGTGNDLLTLGAITHSFSPTALTTYNASYGGLATFSFAGTLGATNAINTTTLNSNGTTGAANGILGGWAAYQVGTTNPIASYASVDATGNIVAYTGYTAQAAGPITSDTTKNYQVQATGAVAITTANALTTDVNTLSLSSATTGATTITIGTTGILRTGVTGGFLVGGAAGSLTITGGTGLTAGGATNAAGEINFYESNSTGNATGITITAPIINNGTGVVSVTVGGSQGGGGSIINFGSPSTYTGGTTLTTGRVILNNATGFGTGAVTVLSGAQVYQQAGGTIANNFNLLGAGANGGTSYDTTVAIRLAANATLSGTITLLGDAAIGGGSSTLSGPITGNYNLTLGRASNSGAAAGTITVASTSNNYGGNTILTDGQVTLGNSNVIPDGASAGNVILSSAVSAAVLELNAKSETINGLSSAAAAVGTGTVRNTATGASLLTLGGNDQTAIYNGTISDSGAGKTLALTKTGAGTQTLGGANTYIGATLVNLGQVNLVSTGSLGATAVTVGNNTITPGVSGNATLQVVGNYTVGTGTQATGTGAAKITVTGGDGTTTGRGTLSLFDNAINTLSINTASGNNGLTFGSGAVLNLDANLVQSDAVSLSTGAKASATGTTVNLNFLTAPNSNQTYTLISAPGGGLTAGGTDFTLGTFSGASTAGTTFSLNETATALFLTATIPGSAVYFRGNLGSSWNTVGNFTTDAAGTTAASTVPSAIDVHFYAQNADLIQVAASTLDAAFSIKQLAVDGAALGESAPVGIAPGAGGSLTITPASASQGITINSGAGTVTISAPVKLGAAQTWTNNSSNPLAISGNVTVTGSPALTIAGTGTTALSGKNSIASVHLSSGAVLQLVANAANTTAGVSSALATPSGGLFPAVGTSNIQFRSDASVTFNGGDNMPNLNATTINYDVNHATAAGTNQTISFGLAGSNVGTANTFNVTGGSGYTLALGKFTEVSLTSSQTLVPTTANLSVTGLDTNKAGATCTFVLDGTASNNFVTGGITQTAGTTAILKSNSSTWTLQGTNTYSGGTTINDNGGILAVTNSSGLGTGNVTIGSAAGNAVTGTLQLSNNIAITGAPTVSFPQSRTAISGGGSANIQNLSGANSLSANLSINGAGGAGANILSTAGSLTLSGNLTVTNGSRVYIFSGAGDTIVTGAILVGTGTGTGVTQAGPGALTLSGPNTYAGGTTLTAGTLNLNSATALGATASSFTITAGTIDSTATFTNQLITANNAQTWNGNFAFTGTNSLNLGTGAVSLGSTAGARTVTVNANTLTVGGVISNGTATGLTKAGAGTLALTGASVYTGTTTVTAGKLAVSGSISGTTMVINSGTLLLNSSTNANNIVGNGTAAPVASSQTITGTVGTTTYTGTNGSTLAVGNTNAGGVTNSFASLTLSGASMLDLANGNTNNNFIFGSLDGTTAAALTAGTATLNIANWSGTVYDPSATQDTGTFGDNQSRLLFANNPGFAANTAISGITFGGSLPGMEVSFGTQFEIVPIPEPSVLGLSLLGLGLAGYRERRRLRKVVPGVH